MGLRITTWNVNGIRNPFGYQPWRDARSYTAMFDILQSDIVVFQETKIQRKDLSDDMVLVPGWDCYFSLPQHKKGYSGVVIYTRQSVCAPVRAEEGITGILCPPNSSTSFSNLPEAEQIGGYPTPSQSASLAVDATALDSEGRCVILEFPAFILFGVYSPANRDETRDNFRLSFLGMLDARIRNLIAMGKRVFLTGDLNISKEELDAANAEASMRKQGLSDLQFVSTPARRLLNQLLEGGKVLGEKDEGRAEPVMWDICRAFHPGRKGMFTCWEQKVNARPANCGARIDYVLCSLAMKDWFSNSDIQEGLMGSDHCPVYAVMKDKIHIDGEEWNTKDVMNPPGMFSNGERLRQYSTLNDPLPLSGKLIPEFFGRRNIRDMFARQPSLRQSQSTTATNTVATSKDTGTTDAKRCVGDGSTMQSFPTSVVSVQMTPATALVTSSNPLSVGGMKRHIGEVSTNRNLKRAKSGSSAPMSTAIDRGQQSLKGFFKPKSDIVSNSSSMKENVVVSGGKSLDGNRDPDIEIAAEILDDQHDLASLTETTSPLNSECESARGKPACLRMNGPQSANKPPTACVRVLTNNADLNHDGIQSKESWSKLFTKPAAPRCEGHDEPCISLLTKKSGMNMGRSFFMCPRPLGPSGTKEKNTQWRCQTFIWCSDWNPSAAKSG